MNKPISVSHTFSGTEKTISFETGRLAGLAGGAKREGERGGALQEQQW